jgi:hypothetical protein
MDRHPFHRRAADVGGLLAQVHVAGDAVVLQAGLLPQPRGLDELPDVVEGCIVSHVPVELPVVGIPRVPLLAGPDLLRRLGVPAEGRDPGRREDRGIDPEDRRGAGMVQAVGVHQEVADALFRQEVLHSFVVAALRQPDPVRAPAEMALELRGPDGHLGPDRFRVGPKDRQQPVGRRAGHQFQAPGVRHAPEGPNQVPPIPVHVLVTHVRQAVLVEAGHRQQVRIVPEPPGLPAGQFQRPLDVPLEPPLVMGILHHGRQGRRDHQVQGEWHPVGQQALHHRQQREVGLDRRLVIPVLFQEELVFRMLHERQVGVKHQGEGSAGHSDLQRLPGRPGSIRGRPGRRILPEFILEGAFPQNRNRLSARWSRDPPGRRGEGTATR